MEITSEIYQNFENPQTIEKALDLYGNRLMRFINCYLNDIYQAEDIMMEVFVELLVRKPSFENHIQFQSYLYRAAKNKSINYWRKHKKLTPLDNEILADIADLEKTLYRSALDKKLHKALSKINPKYRQVLTLTYYDGMKNAEIARILDVNEKAVINLKHRAKRKLNHVLSKENFIFNFKEDL